MMNRKVERSLDYILETLRTWDSVDTIAMVKSGEDIYDPYFFLSLDVYYRGEIPDAASRIGMFADTAAFESSKINKKDRFLLNDTPFRIEYKDLERFDSLVRGAKGSAAAIRDSGTYVFHRIVNAQVLYQKSKWIDDSREILSDLPDTFWKELRSSMQARMEHYFGDLSAAVVREDDLFYMISAVGFIQSLSNVLFAVNREFEPSGRMLADEVNGLRILPDSFEARFESFLRLGDGISPDRKRELAELLAKSVIAL
jgi:hypothetical protein